MRRIPDLLFPALLFLAAATAPLLGQDAAPAPQAAAPATQAPATASSMLLPALGRLHATLDELRIDKWKAPGPVREDASSNIGSIRNDLDATLPPLLATADAAPGSLSKTFPVYRNIEALYDVLLRVVGTADLAAPDEQSQNLQSALAALEDARNALGGSIAGAAATEENRDATLTARVRTLEAAVVSDKAEQEAAEEKSKPAVTHHRHHVAKPTAQPQQQ